jgi:hypothetical protein
VGSVDNGLTWKTHFRYRARLRDSGTDGGAAEHARTSEFLLGRMESRVLPWLAARVPRRIVPDHLTLLGVVASVGIAASYLLTNRDPMWLWAASAGLVVHRLGDSLDGTLARHREIQRPRYGFYLDHVVDAFSTVFDVVGVAVALGMLGLLMIRIVRNLRRLARLEPPSRPGAGAR